MTPWELDALRGALVALIAIVLAMFLYSVAPHVSAQVDARRDTNGEDCLFDSYRGYREWVYARSFHREKRRLVVLRKRNQLRKRMQA
ncbi:hypothetical protein [Cryobacterium cryoconiti]|uniref:Uncharacterized protein n=1 Tax=Cryobacterium cryoconiti TaxID=1259239 RepID=A0A4Y8JRG8_9MICO|nr:hypothetical protein [Cryobacterium cryoconiti]TFD27502.1 hypothetical protein E3T49_13250 [Cryobacterium cryoconiti]